MKKLVSIILTALLLAAAFSVNSFATGTYVSNNESITSEGVTSQIEELFEKLFEKNGCRVYFYIVSTFSGEEASSVSDRIYAEKGIADNGDCGVVFVLASQDPDYDIKVGKGVSDVITYDVAKELLSSFEESFAQGMTDAGVFALANEICTKLTPLAPLDGEGGTSVFLVILLIVLTILFLGVVAFIILYIRAERIRRRRRIRRMSGNYGNNIRRRY